LGATLNSFVRLARCLGATRTGATIGGFLVDDPPLIVITSFGIIIGIIIITRTIFIIFLLRLQGHEPVVLFHI
jgi:quinol-cytochrome oxidoreductase complex cytochrome b subunit